VEIQNDGVTKGHFEKFCKQESFSVSSGAQHLAEAMMDDDAA